jgi:diacylglycerol kinase (ATP)
MLFFLVSWHIIMRMRIPKEGSFDPIAPLELPHSLHAFHRVSHSDSLNMVSFWLHAVCAECEK